MSDRYDEWEHLRGVRWEVAMVDVFAGSAPAIADGWEPFAVTPAVGHRPERIWIRRQRP